MEQALQELLDKQACTELVYRFARGLDRVDEAIIRSVFHPDGTDHHGAFRGDVDAFVSWVLPMLAPMERTQHVIGNVLVEVDGDRAWSEAYFVAFHDMSDAEGNPLRTTVAGRYLDRFERRAGEWRIAHRTFVSDWSASDPRTDSWDRSPGSARLFGRRDRQDPVYAESNARRAAAA